MTVALEAPLDVHEQVRYVDSQQQVLQYILYDPLVDVVLYYGDVRGGKSFAICKAALQCMEFFPGSANLLARDTRVNLEATTLDTLFGADSHGNLLLPPGIYSERDHNRTKGFINWWNGSKLCMWGLDNKQNIDRIKSSQWSFVGLEEATGIAWGIIRFILDTRMSHPQGPRKALLTTNTDRGQEEVYKYFFEEHNCDPSGRFCKACLGPCRKRRVYAELRANAGNLPRSFMQNVERLEKTDPRYHAIYMRGQWANVTGSIFPEYSETVHIIDLPEGYEFPEEWPKVRAYDHGWGASPSCLLEARIAPDGTIIYTDEYYTDPEQRPDVGSISEDFAGMGVNYVHFADPSIRAKNQYRSEGRELSSVQDLFAEHGVTMDLANNDVNGGIERMKTLLRCEQEHRCPIPGAAIEGLPNQPYLYIARIGGYLKAPNLNRQMKKYRNKETVRGEQNPTSWDPVKIDDHALDPARYIVNGRPVPGKTEQQQAPRGTSGWAKRLQLEKKAQTGDGLQEIDGFRIAE